MATITGTNDSETLNGTSDPDRIFAYGGNDTLNGFGGDDELDGRPGADVLNGGDGSDIAEYGGTAGVTASLDPALTKAGDVAGDTYISIENLGGSRYDDKLFGDS